MEECCAVCAEPLTWVGVGPCLHRDVCSTCVIRLRTVLKDCRCCICKQECPIVLVTRALGEFTRRSIGFEALEQHAGKGSRKGKEEGPEGGGAGGSHAGRGAGAGGERASVGGETLWFDADSGAFFDDQAQFRRIRALCQLHCSVCESGVPEGGPGAAAGNPGEAAGRPEAGRGAGAGGSLLGPGRGAGGRGPGAGAVPKGFTFRRLGELKHHLGAVHGLVFCTLCLEARKVFISEQRQYTRAQLEEHQVRGAAEVDGTSEGGEMMLAFKGHPRCDFCRERFYGETELYQHMTVAHEVCHLCQRANPQNTNYYRNYDDLENHFRDQHFPCEDRECLEKKFVVFSNEMELKRHIGQEHAGNMTRAERNRALQIPASQLFTFSHAGSGDAGGASSSGQGHLRGAGRNRDGGGRGRNMRSGAAQHGVSLAAAAAVQESLVLASSRETADLERALRESMRAGPGAASASPRGGGQQHQGSAGPGAAGAPRASVGLSSHQAFPSLSAAPPSGPSSGAAQAGSSSSGSGPSAYRAVVQRGPGQLEDTVFPPLPSGQGKKKKKGGGQRGGPSMAHVVGGPAGGGGIQVLHLGDGGRNSQSGGSSAGAQNHPSRAPTPPSPSVASSSRLGMASGPPPAASPAPAPAAGPAQGSGARPAGADLRAANKELVEQIKARLGVGPQGTELLPGASAKFQDFKDKSQQFQRGAILPLVFYAHIARLGLQPIVPELARLCPDPQQRQQLLEAHARAQSLGGGTGRQGAQAEAQAEGSVRAAPAEGPSASVGPQPARGLRGSASAPNLAASGGGPGGGGSARSEHHFPALPPAQPVPSASSSSREGWACSKCTLLNSGPSDECQACGSPGPGQAASSSNSASKGKGKKGGKKGITVRMGDGSVAALLGGPRNTAGEPPASAWGQPAQQPTPPAGGPSLGSAWATAGPQRSAQRPNSAWGPNGLL